MEKKLSQTAVVACPRNMVGRVIGKGGETIKALQQYTGAVIQIDQSQDPTRVTIAGADDSLKLALSMIKDIVASKFKGFAMLRQMGPKPEQEQVASAQPAPHPRPLYVEGYGFVPPSQFSEPEGLTVRSLAPHTPSRSSSYETQQDSFATAPVSTPQYISSTNTNGHTLHYSSGADTGSSFTPKELEHLLYMLSTHQLEPSRERCVSCSSPTKPIPVGSAAPVGLLGSPTHDNISAVHGTHLSSLYSSSLVDAPATPTQIVQSNSVLSGDDSYGSPASSYSQSSSASPLSHPLQGYSSAPAQSASVSRALFPAPHSLGLPQSLSLDLGGTHEDVTKDAHQHNGLLAGWMSLLDPDGRRFFYNPNTQQSQWDLRQHHLYC